MEKQIKICESASIKVMPDTTNLKITVSAKDESTALAVEQAEAFLSELFDTLVDVGVLRDDIKTEGVNIYPEYSHVREDGKEYTRVLTGYVCTSSLSMEFGCDSEFLTNIITALSCLESMPEISVTYKLNNTTEAEEQLISLVTDKAVFKAKAFCKSLGKRLGELVSVDYISNGDTAVSFCNNDVRFASSGREENMGIGDTTPKEITLSEGATYVWEII